MTPQEEKEFFAKLENGYDWPKEIAPLPEATILRQEDFQFILAALAAHVPESPERDVILKVLAASHRDLLQLFMDIKGILNPEPPDTNKK